ncbi:MAG: hypothetical protein HY084_06725 [Gemmatimonadetes bacterium]|nr:hypothetical protein [Gemmatimonadota bacterium]
MIEMAIAVGVIAVLALIALPNIDFARFRMDGNARNVQNHIIAAQNLAVQRNNNILLTFVYCNAQFRTVLDLNKNNSYDGGNETRTWKTLSEGATFVIPPTTIDGDSRYYVTGPGVVAYNNVAATNGQVCMYSPSVALYPMGSTSGDFVVYLGSPRGRKVDYRAVQVYGATGKVHVWRMMSDGTWKQSDMQ